ncbi:hypothetical protein ACIA5D_40730 [Actinoplanes sp. NPDC051513]|uniref:hypothetical protein n=1 Tax=Actinoplanes sp. NPDC051513 TaxID=3363908 RepID=UPI0037BC8096
MRLSPGTRGRAFVISAVVLAAVGVATIVIAATGSPGATGSREVAAPPGPENAVRGFFDALAAGDARAALAYVEPVPGFDLAADPLLTDAALGPERRPAAVQVSAARQTSGAALVDVTYQARGTTVRQTVGVAGGSGSYRLRDALIGLSVSGVQGRPVTVNGVELGKEDLSTGVFPGSYEVAVDGNALFDGQSFIVVPEVVMGGVAAGVSFSVPDLTGNAAAKIQAQVRRDLDACTTGSSAKPAGCPFRLDVPGTKARVKWSIATYPSVTPKVTEVLGGLVVSLSGDGVAHWTADFVDRSGAARHGSGDLRFSVAGSAKPVGSGFEVSLTT